MSRVSLMRNGESATAVANQITHEAKSSRRVSAANDPIFASQMRQNPYVCINPCQTPQKKTTSMIPLRSHQKKAVQTASRKTGAKIKRHLNRLNKARSP